VPGLSDALKSLLGLTVSKASDYFPTGSLVGFEDTPF
jgi:hypothetical protein